MTGTRRRLEIMTSTAVDGHVGAVGLLAGTGLGWLFRPRSDRAGGIDAELEPVVSGAASGRRLALRIVDTSTIRPLPDGDGWRYRHPEPGDHDRLLGHPLPVLLVGYDAERGLAYWQHVTPQTTAPDGAGWTAAIPRAQRFDVTAGAALAELARRPATIGMSDVLDELPDLCADRLRRLDRGDPALARWLASELRAAGAERRNSVEKLVAGAGAEWSWPAWAALGEYANEHGLPDLAAECFLRTVPPDGGVAHWRALAGLLLCEVDPGRARSLLREALAVPGVAPLAGTGLAWLDGSAGSLVAPGLPPAAGHPTVLRFHADERGRDGDVQRAVALHESVLRLVPGTAAACLGLAEALLHRAGVAGACVPVADCRRAAHLAQAARAARRRCGADSAAAAAVLARAYALAGDDESAVRVALPAPEGEATGPEVGCAALAGQAAVSCYRRGELDRGDALASAVRAGGTADLVSQVEAVRAEAVGAEAPELVRHWQAVLDSGVEDPVRLDALGRLAALGQWPPAGSDGTARVRALAAQGRVDECVRACDESADPRLLLYPLDVLTRAGRTDDVVERAGALCRRADLSLPVRDAIRAASTAALVAREDWAGCVRLAGEGLAEIARARDELRAGRLDPLAFHGRPDEELAELARRQAWVLVVGELQAGSPERALRALRELAPAVATPTEASLWFELHRWGGWTAETVEHAVALCRRDIVPPELAIRILSELRPASDPALHAQVAAARPVEAGLSEAIEPGAAPYQRIREAIRSGWLPLGVGAAASGMPYLLSLLQQSVGLIPAGTDEPDVYRLELAAAAAALGGAVSVETSALYVTAGILNRWCDIAGQFREPLLAAPAAHDILASLAAARAMAGLVAPPAVDPRTGQLRLADADRPGQAIVERGAAVWAAARQCRSVPVDALDDGYPIERVGAWLAPVTLAIAEGTALFSDDVVLRGIARGKGVPAFGTLALFEVLVSGQRRPDDSGALLQSLFEDNVVDLGAADALVRHTMTGAGPGAPAVLLNLSRSAFWADRSDSDLFATTAAVARSAAQDHPDAFPAVVEALALGQASVYEPGAAIALVGLVVLGYVTGVTAEAASVVLPALRTCAARYAVDPEPMLRRHLVAVLTDPQREEPMTVEAASRLVEVAFTVPAP
jgi:hypothetical protein